MLINAVVYTFAPDDTDCAIAMLRELAAASLEEAGCHGFEVNRSLDDPNAIVLYERWADQAALDAHYATEIFNRLGKNGIRTMARSRVGHRCEPIVG